MRIAVLSSPDSWYFADLKRAAGGRHEVQCLSFSRLMANLEIEPSPSHAAGQVPLNQFDAVLVRTMAPGTLEQVVFRMDVLGRLQQQGVPVVNPPRALEAAVDKYLASAKLQAAALPTPPTWVCQTVDEAMEGFEQLGRDVVVKPLFGSEGRGILRVEDPSLAQRVFKTLAQIGAVIYLQKFIPHNGYDIRILLVGSCVFSIRRSNPSDWRTNVSCGATAEAFSAGSELVAMAHRAAEAIGATVAGVDILLARDGQPYVLEVNAVPGWQATARALGVDVAAAVLEYLESIAGSGNAETNSRRDTIDKARTLR
jgi:RimK family alpha-L-glutamate ligase